ncbi:MAG: site-specific DNA-methyltransferase [Candidatus Aminicenantes bacterium]|nr:site-specific DNA-methyltransferase [Candidatus Aminicenantes bacterium]
MKRDNNRVPRISGSIFNKRPPVIRTAFKKAGRVVVIEGDTEEILKRVPNGTFKLIIASPPYNLGKEYELKRNFNEYLDKLEPIMNQLVRVLHPKGSLCWQVGNYVRQSEVFPLDVLFYPFFKQHGLKLRNRVIWHFGHGLHASKRFSGRYETLLWFTKGDHYTFNLNAVRVPAKYPGKTGYRPGKNYGKPSGNPFGKNPSDFWRVIKQDWQSCVWELPNVKANHPEKTIHPCQYPIELVERCVLALTNEGDWVLDPFAGVGSAVLAALMRNRRGMACEKEHRYCKEIKRRINQLFSGTLRYRPLGKAIHKPTGREKVAQVPLEWLEPKSRL